MAFPSAVSPWHADVGHGAPLSRGRDERVRPRRLHARQYALAAIMASALAALLITFVAQSYMVQGASMLDVARGRAYWWTNSRTSYEPRGEVVVFRYPADR